MNRNFLIKFGCYGVTFIAFMLAFWALLFEQNLAMGILAAIFAALISRILIVDLAESDALADDGRGDERGVEQEE